MPEGMFSLISVLTLWVLTEAVQQFWRVATFFVGVSTKYFSYFSLKKYVVGTHWKHTSNQYPQHVFMEKLEKKYQFFFFQLKKRSLSAAKEKKGNYEKKKKGEGGGGGGGGGKREREREIWRKKLKKKKSLFQWGTSNQYPQHMFSWRN